MKPYYTSLDLKLEIRYVAITRPKIFSELMWNIENAIFMRHICFRSNGRLAPNSVCGDAGFYKQQRDLVS